MNPIHRRVSQVECPKCRAEVGQRCPIENFKGSFVEYHQSRLDLVDALFPIRLKIPGPVKIKKENMSAKCKHGSHDLCSGLLRPKYGMRLSCGCACHKTKVKK